MWIWNAILSTLKQLEQIDKLLLECEETLIYTTLEVHSPDIGSMNETTYYDKYQLVSLSVIWQMSTLYVVKKY